ncbi:unnamed protein product [Ostreobium quekettii]|uniref:Thioredoxin domain-containing protein n=1 Tax=Ostreobium quekettii TaxID=121088 RepID=A0A8S1IWR8_9CHLO|nr:unnamed protein product [Ostreobium quekettii]|eukprot:evm.model.scf_1268.4 EVM.evm.TU.scf_1268.4   scf_1268:24628-27910(-)
MAGLQQAVDQAVLAVARTVEDRVDEEIRRLDNLDGDDLELLRERRLAEAKRMAARRQAWAAAGHGEYREVHDEKEFFREVKGEERAVCHFYRQNSPCQVMDRHLTELAQKHIETKFIKINAEKSPYLTDKLKIWMLPTLALIKNGKTVDYVVGFDELGGTDSFPTQVLADRLARSEVVFQESVAAPLGAGSRDAKPAVRKGFTFEKTGSDESSDFSD